MSITDLIVMREIVVFHSINCSNKIFTNEQLLCKLNGRQPKVAADNVFMKSCKLPCIYLARLVSEHLFAATFVIFCRTAPTQTMPLSTTTNQG